MFCYFVIVTVSTGVWFAAKRYSPSMGQYNRRQSSSLYWDNCSSDNFQVFYLLRVKGGLVLYSSPYEFVSYYHYFLKYTGINLQEYIQSKSFCEVMFAADIYIGWISCVIPNSMCLILAPDLNEINDPQRKWCQGSFKNLGLFHTDIFALFYFQPTSSWIRI